MSSRHPGDRVLVVDDMPSILEDFRRILAPGDAGNADMDALESRLFGSAKPQKLAAPQYRLDTATQGNAAVEMVRRSMEADDRYALAFVDMRMPPGIGGVETIERMWRIDPALQVVVCTAHSDHPWDEITARLGQTDRLLLLKKPFDPAEVWQLTLSMTRKWNLDRQAHCRLEELQGLTRETNERLLEQVRRRSEVEEELRHLAYHDVVTGLPNRTFLLDRIEQCLRYARRNSDFRFALFYLDLDNFKLINDTMGHDQGDELLREVAHRLRTCMRSLDAVVRVREDVAARVGGDEFIVLLEGLQDARDSVRVAQRLLEVLSRPFRLEGREVVVPASIGITTSDQNYVRPDDILRDADTAMYRAKSAGKGRYALFDPEMHEAARRRLEIENKLREAIDVGRLDLAYQPIIEVATGSWVGVEALARCSLEGVEADTETIISVAEETGLIIPLGHWVLRRACRDLRSWRDAFPAAEGLRLNVNISRRELVDRELLATLRTILSETGIPPGCLSLEVTESGMIEDVDAAMHRLHGLCEVGVHLHMDDFGTGHSSLACLHKFPLDAVKIDREFTATMINDARYIAVIRAVVTLCHALDMRVTVEGIETEQQGRLIESLGCDMAQGYHFARPMSAESVTRALRNMASDRAA